MPNKSVNNYSILLSDIGTLLVEGRKKSFQQVNTILVETYWNIGRRIVEHEQQGKEKAQNGSRLLKKPGQDLKRQIGKGFNPSHLPIKGLP